MTPDILVLGLTWFVVFLFSTTLHEAGHAFAAYKLGDPTAYEGGQVSLNPLPHIQREPLGMILVPIITFAANGWMMGWASAPYDPLWAHRYPKRAAIMALAGPAGNLILALIAGLIIRVGLNTGIYDLPAQPVFERLVVATEPGSLAEAAAVPLSILFFLNLLLFLFNLLPLPPLDGSAVLPAFMSNETAARYNAFLHQPMVSLLGLIVAWRVFPFLFSPVINFVLRLLYGLP
ncbi:MAG TPA: site-2 protease family protein [Thermoanaerobaculia bacterium]|nr:site-2 protease family protein [Thermoanaerobaculia bacterium]